MDYLIIYLNKNTTYCTTCCKNTTTRCKTEIKVTYGYQYLVINIPTFKKCSNKFDFLIEGNDILQLML